MVEVTRWPQHYEACMNSATMVGGNAKNVALQLRVLWCCKSQWRCGIAAHGVTVLQIVVLRRCGVATRVIAR
jgi:hypothetical protein